MRRYVYQPASPLRTVPRLGLDAPGVVRELADADAADIIARIPGADGPSLVLVDDAPVDDAPVTPPPDAEPKRKPGRPRKVEA